MILIPIISAHKNDDNGGGTLTEVVVVGSGGVGNPVGPIYKIEQNLSRTVFFNVLDKTVKRANHVQQQHMHHYSP